MTLPEPGRDGAPGGGCTVSGHRAPGLRFVAGGDCAPGRDAAAGTSLPTDALCAPGARFAPGPGGAAGALRETLTT